MIQYNVQGDSGREFYSLHIINPLLTIGSERVYKGKEKYRCNPAYLKYNLRLYILSRVFSKSNIMRLPETLYELCIIDADELHIGYRDIVEDCEYKSVVETKLIQGYLVCLTM